MSNKYIDIVKDFVHIYTYRYPLPRTNNRGLVSYKILYFSAFFSSSTHKKT